MWINFDFTIMNIHTINHSTVSASVLKQILSISKLQINLYIGMVLAYFWMGDNNITIPPSN
jgi:hypothetical protein